MASRDEPTTPPPGFASTARELANGMVFQPGSDTSWRNRQPAPVTRAPVTPVPVSINADPDFILELPTQQPAVPNHDNEPVEMAGHLLTVALNNALNSHVFLSFSADRLPDRTFTNKVPHLIEIADRHHFTSLIAEIDDALAGCGLRKHYETGRMVISIPEDGYTGNAFSEILHKVQSNIKTHAAAITFAHPNVTMAAGEVAAFIGKRTNDPFFTLNFDAKTGTASSTARMTKKNAENIQALLRQHGLPVTITPNQKNEYALAIGKEQFNKLPKIAAALPKDGAKLEGPKRSGGFLGFFGGTQAPSVK